MRLLSLLALATVAATVFACLPTSSADAQTRRRVVRAEEPYPGANPPRVITRTRITVRRARSFLDPGTEVLPHSQPSLDYALPPMYYPSRNWDATGARRFPLPEPYDIPGFYP